MFYKTITERLSLGERILLIILFFIFFPPFFSIFAVGTESSREYINLLIGTTFFIISFIFFLAFQKIRPDFFERVLFERIFLFIILPAVVVVFLIYLSLAIFPETFPFSVIAGPDPHGFHGPRYQDIIALLIFNIGKFCAYILLPAIILWFNLRFFQVKITFTQFLYNTLKSFSIFYIGIPTEIGDKFFNSFLIGDIFYSLLTIGWIAILIKMLQNLVKEENQKTKVDAALVATLTTFTFLYYVISGIFLLNLQPFVREKYFEILTFHRLFLILPVASIFSLTLLKMHHADNSLHTNNSLKKYAWVILIITNLLILVFIISMVYFLFRFLRIGFHV